MVDSRPVVFVDDPSLMGHVDTLAVHTKLGLDLEADSFHRYFEKVCLIQLSAPDFDVLLDPLNLGMPQTLRGLLESSNHTFVLHGADFDVLSLRRDFDLELGNVFDTMIAARLLGRSRLGLSALLADELGVHISKAEQRSDWAARPLTPAQIEYARTDTMHLVSLAERLSEQLEDRGRLSWLEEECLRLKRRRPHAKTFDEAGFWKLAPRSIDEREARALHAAFVWRDEQARAQDRPPFRVLQNEALVTVALTAAGDGTGSIPRLAGRRGFPKSRSRLESLAQSVEKAFQTGARFPARAESHRPPPVSESVASERSRLKAVRDAIAADLGIDPSVLLTSANLDVLAHSSRHTHEDLQELLGTWRTNLLEAQLS